VGGVSCRLSGRMSYAQGTRLQHQTPYIWANVARVRHNCGRTNCATGPAPSFTIRVGQIMLSPNTFRLRSLLAQVVSVAVARLTIISNPDPQGPACKVGQGFLLKLGPSTLESPMKKFWFLRGPGFIDPNDHVWIRGSVLF